VNNQIQHSDVAGVHAEGTIRVVAADEHPIFRIGLRTLLSAEPGIELVGEAEDGGHAIDLIRELRPEVLLLDLHLPGMNGLDVLQRLAALNLTTRAVLLTAAIERDQLRTALVRGARGVVLKQAGADLLTKCIRQVSRGEYWVGRDSVGDLVDALRHPERIDERPGGLTSRERQIVGLIVTGASNRGIAADLGLNEQTVKNHLHKIFDKLQVGSRVELALAAVERGLVGSADDPSATSSQVRPGPVPDDTAPDRIHSSPDKP
jgi:DNA-binding NarL/FixJ family response regulator